VKYHGPIQVTAVYHKRKWHVIEYNIRIGVTSGAMILRLLENPVEILLGTARNEKLKPRFRTGSRFGASVTLAGYGYPYGQVRGPQLPVEVLEPPDADVWWNDVEGHADGKIYTSGHRVADVIGFGQTLEHATAAAYANIKKIRLLGSYYRSDIGRSLWPPGHE
jgi:phosphoribosylamine-glycine ligase